MKMIKIHIDGKTYEVESGKNLLHTCLALGFDIPYFCFHPALGSVGACRQCAVKKFNGPDDKRGRIVMSCMEPLADGMIITTNDDEIHAFRAAIIEGLMTNHPHDCPICDEGGECHLQDMTVMTGHAYRRFNFPKRTFSNQYLGPFISHEMNRCIQCYRCVRFYRDFAGGKDLNVSGSANHIYFGRPEDGVLESEFSGNLAEVCPTGVFTDKTLNDHYARKWDLSGSPSVCVHCSLGCNIIVSERYGMVRRVLNRYNDLVNGYFLCDRGRFGYEFLNNPERLTKPMVRNSHEDIQKEISWQDLKTLLESTLKGKRLAGIGSSSASLESNYTLEKLVGRENFYCGLSAEKSDLVKAGIEILKNSPAEIASLKTIALSDALLVLGEDLTNTAPMMALAVRQAAHNKAVESAEKIGIPSWNDAALRERAQKELSPVIIAAPFTTKLDELAVENFKGAPADISRLGFGIASAIDRNAPSPGKGEKLKDAAEKAAAILLAAERPVIITGVHCSEPEVLHSAANIASALSAAGKKVSLAVVFEEANSIGTGLMNGKSADDLAERASKGEIDTLIILENDLYRNMERGKADQILSGPGKIILLDSMPGRTTVKADIVIPVGAFTESSGTVVNNEGRAQRYFRAIAEGEIKDAWRLINEMREIAGAGAMVKDDRLDEVTASLSTAYPVFSEINEISQLKDTLLLNEKIARQTPRASGRTAMNANINVSEPKPPADNDSPMAFSMEGFRGLTPSNLTPYYWSAGWNSVQAVSKYLDEPSGKPQNGNEGILVIKKPNDYTFKYYSDIPGQFVPGNTKFFVLPVWRIFGSERLSSSGKAVSELIPELFVLLNSREISRLNLTEERMVKLKGRTESFTVKLLTDNNLPDGIAGVPVLNGTLQILFDKKIEILKED